MIHICACRMNWRRDESIIDVWTNQRRRESVNWSWERCTRLSTARCKTASIWNPEDTTTTWTTRRNSAKHTLATAKDILSVTRPLSIECLHSSLHKYLPVVGDNYNSRPTINIIWDPNAMLQTTVKTSKTALKASIATVVEMLNDTANRFCRTPYVVNVTVPYV